MFGSVRSLRSGPTVPDDDDATSSAASSKAPSVNWDTAAFDAHPSTNPSSSSGPSVTNVILHGEVQTSSNLFRKKKEYLVLTDAHLIRFKSQSKAADSFPSIAPSRTSYSRHSSAQSLSSMQDLRSNASDASDRHGWTSLRHIVAVHRLADAKSIHAIEICFLDEDLNQPSALALQFAHTDDPQHWLTSIRNAAAASRLATQPAPTASHHNTAHAARIVERDSDYDPQSFAIYKVVQRHSRSATTGSTTNNHNNRPSTDDLGKFASTVCLLVIGIHKLHLIHLPRSPGRTSSSSPSLAHADHGSYGILTLTALKVGHTDDTLHITFRLPSKRPKVLYLASAVSHEIALRLLQVENALRPEYPYRLFRFQAPRELEDTYIPRATTDDQDHCGLVTTLTAYCMAYHINPATVRYTINYTCDDAPRFELLSASDTRRRDYSPIELLAVMRSLRYNETFGSISFANICLDCLNTVHDPYGAEFLCTRTKRGTPIQAGDSDLQGSSLLVQEIRALAATSSRLRRLDFTNCINASPSEHTMLGDEDTSMVDTGCGIVEALFPLCKYQNTNVDWIVLDGIALSDADLDYLVAAAGERACRFRALEVGRCGLQDRTLGLVLDTLRLQDHTLEALNLSGNLARLSPAVFDAQISVFGFIRRLDLSNLSRTSGEESLLPADTLLTWRLEVLRLSGTTVNKATVDAIATYLRDARSDSLHELCLDNVGIVGSDAAALMEAMTRTEPRGLHLDISANRIAIDHSTLADAISRDKSPTHVSLRSTEYRDTSTLRHLFNAFRKNTSTIYLDVSRTSMPGDASEDTSKALEQMLAENVSLEELDISGEDSRLETSKFGPGLFKALEGIKVNTKLHTLRVEYQKLGLQGANVLADALKANAHLRELHCEYNAFPLSGFTDLVNALCKNTTLVFLPLMTESRVAALKMTERQVKQIRDDRPMSPQKPTPPPNKSSFGVRRGFANVRQSVSRGASNYTPSFPSFPYLNSPHLSSGRPGDASPVASSPRLSSFPAAPPLMNLSEQDVQAALRLVAESWDRQQYRLQKYLERNWCIMNNVPTPMEIDEEDFERPNFSRPLTRNNEVEDTNRDSMASFRAVLEQVKIDSTPRLEKKLEFDSGLMSTLDLHAAVDRPEVPAGPNATAGAAEVPTDYLSPLLGKGLLSKKLEHSPLSFEGSDTAEGITPPTDTTGLGLGIQNNDEHDDAQEEVLTPRPY